MQWLGSVRLGPQTLAGYERDAYHRITPFIGLIKLRTFASHLNGLYRTLEESGCPGGRGPLSPSTVRNVHATLCSALSAAVRDDLIPVSHAKKATPPTPRQVKSARPPMRTWSADLVRTFLDATSGDRLGPLWHLLLTIGMRRGKHWLCGGPTSTWTTATSPCSAASARIGAGTPTAGATGWPSDPP